MGARGPKPTCECGTCTKCRNRAKTARWRKKSGYKDPNVTERVRAWREVNRERDNATALARYHALDEEGKKRWRARGMVNDHIRRGTLERQPCEVCGANGSHAHHDDYDLPLEVRWLCSTHHAEFHAKEKV